MLRMMFAKVMKILLTLYLLVSEYFHCLFTQR
jgi:hypothetical protein